MFDTAHKARLADSPFSALRDEIESSLPWNMEPEAVETV
jgi:hypothetical protein